MRNYECMFILRPDLNESERTNIFNKIKDILNKFNAKIDKTNIWAEKRKLNFELSTKGKSAKFSEGLYYLLDFESLPSEITKISATFRLEEDILRFLILAKDNTEEGLSYGKPK